MKELADRSAGGPVTGRQESFRRGVILDVDGTLWDAVREIADSLNLFGQSREEVTRHITYEVMKSCLGKTMNDIADILYGYLPAEKRVELTEEAFRLEVSYLWDHPGTVFPGVKDTLIRLAEEGWHLYIVSNCQQGYIEDFIHASGTESLIEDHICYGDTLQEKDYSIRLCAERNRLDYAVYVGDTEGDKNASLKAGTDFIFARYGFGELEDMEGVKGTIDSFTELPEVLAGIIQSSLQSM